MVDESSKILVLSVDCPFTKLPDQLLIEIFIRVPFVDWRHLSCVNKYLANLFREDCLWHAAIVRCFPFAAQGKGWPGPIPRGISKRRFSAIYTGKCIFSLDDDLCEIVGHACLFLKEQLEIPTLPAPSGILHGTIIGPIDHEKKDLILNRSEKRFCWMLESPHLTNLQDHSVDAFCSGSCIQFIACGKSRDRAYELASLIWSAVIENLEDNHQTFLLLKRLAFEGDIFLQYPYSRSDKVEWKILERLFTDFRDCLCGADYYDLLACAKQKYQPIPPTWLGY